MKKILGPTAMALLLALPFAGRAQAVYDTLPGVATLQQCVQFAVVHQPLVQQALAEQQIVESAIKSKLADWYPQLGLTYNYQNYFQLPSTEFAGTVVHTGTYDASTAVVQLTQNIFDRDVLLASRTAKDVRIQAKQLTEADKIALAVNVTQAFYAVLLNLRQIDLTSEDIVRLQRSLKDAYSQYQAGVVDKIDYKRATISLNNSMAQRKGQEDSLKAKYAALKLAMGYPAASSLQLEYDSAKLQKEIYIDTLQEVNFENRVEYRFAETQKRLLQQNVQYNKLAYYPTVSAFGAYNFNWFNNSFTKLYGQNYPYSYVGVQLSLPIFQGFKRQQDIKGAQLQLQQFDYSVNGLKDTISTQYVQALAAYKSNLYNYGAFAENLKLATEVYTTLQVQYRAGIKTYLDVITAEDDLRTAEISYTDALYQLLISKVSVQKALGIVQY